MKTAPRPELKISIQITGIFLLGFIFFYAIFDPYWLAITFGREPILPNIAGAFVGAIFVAFPLFFPYFFVVEKNSIRITSSTKKTPKRIFKYFLSLSPFLVFNLFSFLLVAGDWTGPKYILGNDILFLLGLFLIVLPTVASFIYFNEKYYRLCQEKK